MDELSDAGKLAAMLWHFEISAKEAKTLDSTYWRCAANLCQVKLSVELKKEAIEILQLGESTLVQIH
jgi:hypothetical protein